jgi:hypothetical protein
LAVSSANDDPLFIPPVGFSDEDKEENLSLAPTVKKGWRPKPIFSGEEGGGGFLFLSLSLEKEERWAHSGSYLIAPPVALPPTSHNLFFFFLSTFTEKHSRFNF